MKQKITLIGALTAAAALMFAADLKTDYSHSTDFSRYHTYSWIKAQGSDSLWSDRIQRDIDNELSSKGWTRVPSGGDASVSAMGFTKNQQTLETFYDGFGGGWFWRGFGGDGLATTTVENTPVGTLMVDIFDTNTKKLIWRGTDTKALSDKPEHNEKKLEDTVQSMFKHFPPASRG
jgi:Domain of unknown function (DUF4136)